MSTFIIFGASWTVIGIAGAAFVAIMAVGWMIAEHLSGGSTRSESRLDQLRNSNSPTAVASGGTSAKDRMAKLLESASPAMSGAMKPKNEKDVDKLRDKLRAANLRSDQAVPMFYTAKAIFGCLGLFVSGAGQAMRRVAEEMQKSHKTIANEFELCNTQLQMGSTRETVLTRQIAEEKAAKTAVQLIFPLVLFIFPGIFVVLVGPAAIRVANDFLTL